MNKRRAIKWLIVLLVVGLPLSLFYLQNSETYVDLVFKISPDLAWHLGPSGISLPLLLILTFLLGMLACALPLAFLVSRSGSRVRGLRRQLDALEDEVEFSRSSSSSRSKGPAAGDFDDII